MTERTEEPTPSRLRRAQREGDVAVSAPLAQAAGFVVAVALLPAATDALAARLGHRIPAAIAGAVATPAELATDVLALSVPLVAAVALAAGAVQGVQAGGVFAIGRVAPDPSRLDPVRGLRGLVSSQRLFTLARAAAGAAFVGWVAVRVATTELGSAANAVGDARSAAPVAAAVIGRVATWAAVVGLALGAVDLLLVRRAWLARLRMTKTEVARDHQESEGDPELKAARKRAHQELLASVSVAAVREATVLIVNPTHLATALAWDEERDEAPRVLAQGDGDLARRMIEAAHQWGVPVVRDIPVARALAELAVGDEIPEALYEAVAEILRDLAEHGEAPP
ncbi:MAG: EscU/YscU/HrcU family type III secretion system export apparatus switch protein [Polyangiaceae bacterium]|nr:EscU/YscU/HrcU family type III secretion system export apparatus switch protein [Polyangiaceae bacterium]